MNVKILARNSNITKQVLWKMFFIHEFGKSDDIYENGTNEILLSKVRNEVFISFLKFGIANSEFKAELVKEGKIKYIGLSEFSAETLRRAYKVHPIVEVQIEYSFLDS
ncbi:hypothetical protein RhiirA4_477719 [Rhizophagus irregularis]|uniref:NADP-dependent oxidoreductase domain-containing protein n=1 Tax=Rhizophagus irregularis TaxID=588596 RepID=A0A2I1HDN8_9GLOM|nr:hypothetical protein RhiirA4_477719 [Rhizophagus irregularis]